RELTSNTGKMQQGATGRQGTTRGRHAAASTASAASSASSRFFTAAAHVSQHATAYVGTSAVTSPVCACWRPTSYTHGHQGPRTRSVALLSHDCASAKSRYWCQAPAPASRV